MQIIYNRLYKTSSSAEEGTLYQLRNLINRRNVVQDPSKDFNACEDFFLLVLSAHILSAGMKEFGMSNIRSVPADVSISTKCDIESAAMKIVEEYVDIQYPVIREKKSSAKKEVEEDRVKEYGKEVLTLGCFYLEYRDAIREGDGVRVLRCWKFLLLYCRATGHSKYANEALNILLQHEFILPPRLSEQLLYSRFVNTAGLPGKNIAADLQDPSCVSEDRKVCPANIRDCGKLLLFCRYGEGVGCTHTPIPGGRHGENYTCTA